MGRQLITRMGVSVRDVIRGKGTPYHELGLGNPDLTDDQLLDAMMAHPILIQVYFNSGLAYLLNRVAGEQHCVAGPSA